MLDRVIVVDVHEKGEPANPMRLANPEIVWSSDEKSVCEEGCLSVPEQYAEVTRPQRIRVRYLDEKNQQQEIEADGMLATCIQHEIDHLNGVLFVDYLSMLKRNILLKKVQKMQKATA